MQKWYSTLFHLSPKNRRYFLFTERSLDFQKSQIGPHLHLSLSPVLCFPAARRTPPVDFVHHAPAAKWTRGNLSAPPGRPLAPSRAHTRPRRLPEPPRHPGRRSAAASSARSPSSRPGPNRPPPDTTSLAQELLGL